MYGRMTQLRVNVCNYSSRMDGLGMYTDPWVEGGDQPALQSQRGGRWISAHVWAGLLMIFSSFFRSPNPAKRNHLTAQ